MIFDTHTHIYLPEFEKDLPAVIERASSAGVVKMMLPNVDVETITPLKNTLSSYPYCCIAAMGLHPTSVTADYKKDIDKIYQEFCSGNYSAIGEAGIDLYWDTTYRVEQIAAFEQQIAWAKEKNLPVIIHNRDAFADTLNSIKRSGWGNVVLHSFGGSSEHVCQVREVCDAYFGINGVVTFKNGRLHDTVKEIGLSRLLIETDAPYLAPVPYRGKRNEPSYITNTIEEIAKILSVPSNIVAETAYKNACDIFSFNRQLS